MQSLSRHDPAPSSELYGIVGNPPLAAGKNMGMLPFICAICGTNGAAHAACSGWRLGFPGVETHALVVGKAMSKLACIVLCVRSLLQLRQTEMLVSFAPGTGNLALAAGKGMGKPAFRIIQTHFAAANNVGDVAAKEEVLWCCL